MTYSGTQAQDLTFQASVCYHYKKYLKTKNCFIIKFFL